MPDPGLWTWLVSVGALPPGTNTGFYTGEDVNPGEIAWALQTAYNALKGGPNELQFWQSMIGGGYISGNAQSYVDGGLQPYEYTHAFNIAAGITSDSTTPEGVPAIIDPGTGYYNPDTGTYTEEPPDAGTTETPPDEEPGSQALPTSMQVVKVGNEYRVIWDLGNGLGSAWYSASPTQLEQAYGPNWQSQVVASYANAEIFATHHGDYYWGDIAEVSLRAEDPWEELLQSQIESFGYVSGFGTDEVRRLILQSFAEEWTGNEFVSHYQQTAYYNSLTDMQRDWSTLSEQERQFRIQQTAGQLAQYYEAQYGYFPVGGLSDPAILAAAKAVASGQTPRDVWEYDIENSAALIEGTPAWNQDTRTTQQKGEAAVTISDLNKTVRDSWTRWMGNTVPMPSNFAEEWSNWLFLNEKSDADLEDRLKLISSSRWTNKPPELTWAEWASPLKGQIVQTLELSTIGDNDRLLNNILDQGLSGIDLNQAIRSDDRFKQTQTFQEQLGTSVSELGKQFGFIA